MSGGKFDYTYSRISYMVDDLEEKIANNNDLATGHAFSEPTLKRLTVALTILRAARDMAYEVEWLYSGDTGEEHFAKRFDEALDKLIKEL
jgi:hypothetical protein